MKVILETEYLDFVLVKQFAKNATDWYAHEKTKKWYDYILFANEYNIKYSKYLFRSEALEKFRRRLMKHNLSTIELNGKEHDFIFEGYPL